MNETSAITRRATGSWRRAAWWIFPLLLLGLIGGSGWSRIRQARLDAELIRAVKAGNAASVEAALRRGARPTATDRPELKADSIRACWQILMGAPSKANDGPAAIQIAYDRACWDGVKALVDHGESPSRVWASRGKGGILHEAAGAGATACCLTLIKHGTDVNVRSAFGYTALMEAAQSGRDETVLALLDNGADPRVKSPQGRTVLTTGAGSLRAETVARLLDAGADASAMDTYDTPLSSAAYLGRAETVRLLLRRGAPVNSKARMGRSPICASAVSGSLETVKLLLDAGATVTEKGHESPLIQVFMINRRVDPQAVRLLLGHGANPNVRGESDMTPLTLAIQSLQPEVVEMLLKHGARTDAIDGEGMTALDYAWDRAEDSNGQTRDKYAADILKMLQAAGAKRASQLRPNMRTNR